MCGITGFFSYDKNLQQSLAQQLPSMTQALYHRGPDFQAQWLSASGLCGLGHARLSILDLSATGNQPMHSTSSRYVIVFNGEIYNYQELKTELVSQGKVFNSQSDTEVLLSAIESWGIEKTLPKLNGMFAFSVWDTKTNSLYLARDHAGEKPLYYYQSEQSVVFSSDLNTFKACPEIPLSIDEQALALLFSHNYIPAPYSIFQNIHKLEPGSYLHISGQGESLSYSHKTYWSAEKAFNQKNQHNNEQHALECFEKLFCDSIEKQMVSDVSLGALLSGGIDSSTVVALMQSLSTKPIDTFTIGFKEAQYDESPHAKAIAKHLGTNHHELILSSKDIQEVIPSLPQIYSEPFADSSQLPTYLVCQLARTHVTVALSGDGGDELFAGYSRYQSILKQSKSNILSTKPEKNTSFSSKIFRHLKTADYILDPVLSQLRQHPTVLNSTKLQRMLLNRTNQPLPDYYRRKIEYWPYGYLNKACPKPANYGFNQVSALPNKNSALTTLQFMDFNTYLPDDILCKVDRAAMANSLETRVPLLDHRLIELSLQFPAKLLNKNGLSKWPLRHILYKHVPKKLIERPKMGFAAPVGLWLKGPLKAWADDLLCSASLDSHNLLDRNYIQHAWKMHRDTDADLSFHLWGVLVFQQWYREWQPYIQ
jgi:asparagine synthase (glutamine-hydrolysing)